jgi:DNA modification methylase
MRAYTLESGGAQARRRTEHPTQKPLRLMAWCLGLAPRRTRCCDPFMGSGTTGVACAAAWALAFTGIERERKYFDIACERISRAQAQGTLLPPEEPRQPVQEGLL